LLNYLNNNLYKGYLKIIPYITYSKKSNRLYKKNNSIIALLLTIAMFILLSIIVVLAIIGIFSLFVILEFWGFFSFSLVNPQNYDKYFDCLANLINNLFNLLNTQSVSCSTEEISLNKKPLDSLSSEENKKIIVGVVAGLLSVGLIITVYNNPEFPAQCWRAIKKFFWGDRGQDGKNPQNDVDGNDSDQDGPGSDDSRGGGSGGADSGGGDYYNKIINKDLNISSINGNEVVGEPEEMFLCDQSILDNANLFENLELNQIQPVINDTQINEPYILEPVNQVVDNCRVIEKLPLNNVEEIAKNNVDGNGSDQDGFGSNDSRRGSSGGGSSGGGSYNNNSINNELNVSSINGNELVDEPKEMFLCDRSILYNANLCENLEVNQIQPVINETQINEPYILEPVNQVVDNYRIIKELPSNNVEEIAKNASIVENTNIPNAELSTGNTELIKELNSQNVNQEVEGIAEQFNKKENKEIKLNKNPELTVNENVNISSETITQSPNKTRWEQMNPDSAWIGSWQRSRLYQENGSTVWIRYDTTISKMLEWFSAIQDTLPLVVLINALLIWGIAMTSIRFISSVQIRNELLMKINIEKKFKYLKTYQRIKKTHPQDWKFKDVEFTDLSIKRLKVKGLKINGLKYTDVDDTIYSQNVIILGGNYSSLYFDDFGFESLTVDDLSFRSFSFDVKALNNDLLNTKYDKTRSDMTYMDYVSIIALGAFIKSIFGYSNLYGVYSNIKYGSVKRASNPNFELLQNSYFKKKFIMYKIKQNSNTMFSYLSSLNSPSQIEERQQLNTLLRNSLETEISEMSRSLNLLNSEVRDQASEIFELEKAINEKAQLIKKIDKENEVFFDKEAPKKTAHSNKNVDTNSEKQEKLNNVPVERVQENLPIQTRELTTFQRVYLERLERHNAELRSRGEREFPKPWSTDPVYHTQQARNTQEFEKPENKKVHQEEKSKEIKQETKPSTTNNSKKK